MSALQTTLRTSQESLATANARVGKLDQQLSAIQAELEAKVTDLTKIQADLSRDPKYPGRAQLEGNSFKVNAEQSIAQLDQARSELAVVSQPGVRAAALPPPIANIFRAPLRFSLRHNPARLWSLSPICPH